jgi:hypothetical protein
MRRMRSSSSAANGPRRLKAKASEITRRGIAGSPAVFFAARPSGARPVLGGGFAALRVGIEARGLGAGKPAIIGGSGVGST